MGIGEPEEAGMAELIALPWERNAESETFVCPCGTAGIAVGDPDYLAAAHSNFEAEHSGHTVRRLPTWERGFTATRDGVSFG